MRLAKIAFLFGMLSLTLFAEPLKFRIRPLGNLGGTLMDTRAGSTVPAKLGAITLTRTVTTTLPAG